MLLFSVITLSYKDLTHLFDTIASVLNQTYPKIEYIICDDGSDCFSKEKVENYIEKHKNNNIVNYQIISNEINVGTVKNINNAYRFANGDYIINLSCGDVFFEKSTLTKIHRVIVKTHAKMIFTSRVMYNNDYDIVDIIPHISLRDRIKSINTKEEQYKEYIKNWMFEMASGSVMCTSKKVLASLDYCDERYFLLEDAPLIERYLKQDRAEFVPEIISIWYEGKGVSNNTSHEAYKRLYNDNLLFNKTQKFSNFNRFSWGEKRYIKFLVEIASNEYLKSKLIVCFKYIPETILAIIYKLKEKQYEMVDLIYLKKIEKRIHKYDSTINYPLRFLPPHGEGTEQ